MKQIGSLGETAQGGWTDHTIAFQGDITDPDAGQQVALHVQVKDVRRERASVSRAAYCPRVAILALGVKKPNRAVKGH
ncbi:MAG: hypothetical protein HY716_05970 [Planctomycetes bacterium]|nr:hypothetical protein [Planctomycetota bacterium]